MPISIEIDDVQMRYPGGRERAPYLALENVNLQVAEGEFFCLLGPSGCGKTTLLNLIAGFELPTRGHVRSAGKDIEKPDRQRGVVFQTERALFDWLTVEENVAFGPKIRGIHKSEWEPNVQDKLKLVGLDKHGQKLPRELSGGMKQRVQIARVLANEPDIMLMDEPFAALDAYTRGKMQKEVSRIWGTMKRTVVFVTHDIAEAIWLADRIAIMTQGPGSFIREIYDVNLPRPRESMTKEFTELFNTLSAAIDAEADYASKRGAR